MSAIAKQDPRARRAAEICARVLEVLEAETRDGRFAGMVNLSAGSDHVHKLVAASMVGSVSLGQVRGALRRLRDEGKAAFVARSGTWRKA